MKARYCVSVPQPEGADYKPVVYGESPEAAAEEVLLSTYGSSRPALAPSRVEVFEVGADGMPPVVLLVDEWVAPRVLFRREGNIAAARVAAERGLHHLRLTRKSLAPFRASAGDPARRGRGVDAELGELESRLEVLVADLGGRP
jgi:hypothetical protein